MMNNIWSVAVSTGHNASTCLLKNDEVVFFIEEERLSRKKADSVPFLGLLEVKKYTNRIDYFAETVYGDDVGAFKNSKYRHLLRKMGLIKDENALKIVIADKKHHHIFHAASGFYNSGFTDAVCVVIDGAGAPVEHRGFGGNEIESVWKVDYNSVNFNAVFKRVGNADGHEPEIVDRLQFVSEPGIGAMYAGLSIALGHGPLECGKAMGLSSYGKEDYSIPYIPTIYESNKEMYPHPHIKEFEKYNKENLCYAVQNVTQRMATSLIMEALEYTGCKNLVISGGYALNCVANYEYLKYIPKDVNVYIDAPSNDAGLSLGAAQYMFRYKAWKDGRELTPPKSIPSMYLGLTPDYNFALPDNFTIDDITPEEVIDLILSGSLVALYQGRSEAGPRALGNRSILFDPRVENGKDIVNEIKRREYYRPFAGSILKQHANEWFDMRGLEESPYMMYAVNVSKDKKKQIPAITHVDGTCRVQTVTEEQNKHYYNLIDIFYKKTGVPILFNTSFNLAGDPLVETVEDGLNTLRNSDLKYMYLPEIGKLITKM
jgi:carbamoyltransferase